jgi:hypothetical protein
MDIPKAPMVLGFIITIILSTTSVAYFFNIETVDYIGYLMWFVALALFYLILPSQNVSVFNVD